MLRTFLKDLQGQEGASSMALFSLFASKKCAGCVIDLRVNDTRPKNVLRCSAVRKKVHVNEIVSNQLVPGTINTQSHSCGTTA